MQTKDKDITVLLVGKSGSGKTTIMNELQKKGYHMIDSYCNRPPRYSGEKGHRFRDIRKCQIDHKDGMGRQDVFAVYTLDGEFEKHVYKHDCVAYAELYDKIYFATKEQFENEGVSIYAIDPKAAKKARKVLDNAVTIMLDIDSKTQQKRLEKRFKTSQDANKSYDVYVTERMARDKEIFANVYADWVVDTSRISIQKAVDKVEEGIEYHSKQA